MAEKYPPAPFRREGQALLRQRKALRKDADDFNKLTINSDGASNDVRITAKRRAHIPSVNSA